MADTANQQHVFLSKSGDKRKNYTEENEENSPRLLKCRVIGYAFSEIVHLGNILAMALALRGPIMKDRDIDYFYSMEFYYITIWNLIFQLVYGGMGLACDFPILLKIKNIGILNHLRLYRRIYFNGILWPCTMIIFTVFWPVYIYDRNLIFPDYVDKALSPVSNYIMHMFIIVPVIWELFFLPNTKPKSHKILFGHSIGLYVVYCCVIFILYAVQGKWPYPLLYRVYGTAYFPVVFIVLAILLVLLYSLQWVLIASIWRNSNVMKGR